MTKPHRSGPQATPSRRVPPPAPPVPTEPSSPTTPLGSPPSGAPIPERLAVAPAGRAPAAIRRSLETVRDHRDGPPLLRPSANILDPLGAEALCDLRAELHTGHAAGTALFTCPACDGALGLRVRGMKQTGITGGGRAFFVHRPGNAAQECALSREAPVRRPDAVDAERFDGLQEGLQHRALKMAFAEWLAREPGVRDVALERRVTHGETYRTPDVQAVTPAGPVAFEVQCATPLATTVAARERFYAEAGYRLVWLMDATTVREDLLLQGFQDLVWSQGGEVLAIDLAGCDAPQAPWANLQRIVLREDAGDFEIDRHGATLAEALDRFAPADDSHRPYLGIDPASREVFAALRTGETARIEKAIDVLCRRADLSRTGREASEDGLPRAVSTLAALLTGRKHDASRHDDHQVVSIVNVCLETARMRPWAPLLVAARGLSPEIDERLEWPSVARKLARARREAAERPAGPDPVSDWAPVLGPLFPRLAPRLGLPRAIAGGT